MILDKQAILLFSRELESIHLSQMNWDEHTYLEYTIIE